MVRPLDLQQIILQSNPVEKLQQTQQKHPEMQQRQFDLELAEEKKAQREKARKLNESEHARIRQEDEKHRGRENRDMRQRQDPDDTAAGGEELTDLPGPGIRIDVKV